MGRGGGGGREQPSPSDEIFELHHSENLEPPSTTHSAALFAPADTGARLFAPGSMCDGFRSGSGWGSLGAGFAERRGRIGAPPAEWKQRRGAKQWGHVRWRRLEETGGARGSPGPRGRIEDRNGGAFYGDGEGGGEGCGLRRRRSGRWRRRGAPGGGPGGGGASGCSAPRPQPRPGPKGAPPDSDRWGGGICKSNIV